MFKITKLIILSLSLCGSLQAAPLNGEAIFEAAGFSAPISGDIDLAFNTMTVNDWFIFGAPVITHNVEILEPGSYNKEAGTVTVPAGHVGAQLEVSWHANIIYVYMIWDASPSGGTYTIIDSDFDGFLGHAMTNGPFAGLTIYYEFTTTPTGPSGPDVNLILTVDGGAIQECTGNSLANITINALPILIGGAELDSITWMIDGEDAGIGLSISEDLLLGSHTVQATALTKTGQYDLETVNVVVRDTTRPDLHIAFIDNKGDEVDSSGPGKVEVSIEATDSCDPEPVVLNSHIREATSIADGDVLKITGGVENLNLTIDTISVTASARDASGNGSFITSKTLILE